MPELPEVETMCRGIAPIVGRTIVDAQRPPSTCRPITFSPPIDELRRRICGQRISGISRRGKRVLIHVADAQVMVIEPRMSGMVLVSDPPTTQHLRLRLLLDGAEPRELLFWDRRGLGTVRLLASAELDQWLGMDRIGEDALSIDPQRLRERLGASRRPIKVALMDQRHVAGIGNLYAAEILHVAGVDPRQRCDALSGPQWSRIHRAISLVLWDAIGHEGSTLADRTYRTSLNQDGRYQNHHRVYDLAGTKCRRCQVGVIRRIVQAQRSTYYCPECQRKTGIHASLNEARGSSRP